MKEQIYRFLIGSDRFKTEFFKELRGMIILTLAFTIAFTWRQTFFDLAQEGVKFFINITNNATLSIVTSSVITVFCVFFIYLTARYMQKV